MTSFADRDRARQEEQLDWLHNQHEELVTQTKLMRRQTDALERIARHTGFLYALAVVWLVLVLLGLVVAFFTAISR